MGAEGFRPIFCGGSRYEIGAVHGKPQKKGNTAALAAPFLEECGQLGVGGRDRLAL